MGRYVEPGVADSPSLQLPETHRRAAAGRKRFVEKRRDAIDTCRPARIGPPPDERNKADAPRQIGRALRIGQRSGPAVGVDPFCLPARRSPRRVDRRAASLPLSFSCASSDSVSSNSSSFTPAAGDNNRA